MTAHQGSRLRSRTGRREFLKLAGLGGGAALLAACSPAATSTPAGATASVPTAVPPTAAATAAVGRVPISFWTPGGSDTFCNGMDTIAASFMKVQPGIEVTKVKCYGDPTVSYEEVLLPAIAAGNPPNSTLIWTSPVVYGARNAAEPLDELMAASQFSQKENWPPGVLASCQWQGKIYGLPATAGTYGIYYNQDAFAAKGIPSDRASFPKTWDDLKKLSAEFVTWDGDTLTGAGFMPWQDTVQLNIWSALNGSQLYDSASGKFTINSEQNIAMMQYSLDWLNEQYKGDLVKVSASDNWGGYADGQGRPPAFQSGKLAMNADGFWLNGDLYHSDFVGWSNWNVAPFPVGPSGSQSVSGYWPNWLIIPKGSKHAAEAFKYLDYMAVEGMPVWFDNIPDLPANKLVAAGLIPKVVIEKRGQAFAADVAAFFRAQLDVATPMWNSPVQDFANDQIGKATSAIMNKASSPKEALGAAQQATQAELERVLKSVG